MPPHGHHHHGHGFRGGRGYAAPWAPVVNYDAPPVLEAPEWCRVPDGKGGFRLVRCAELAVANLGHTAYQHVGDVEVTYDPSRLAGEGGLVSALRLLASGLAAYHGYKRNNGSFGWALAWVAGSRLCPALTTGIAVAQGLGKPKGA